MCLNCQLSFVKIMQLLDEFSKISDIQQSENLHVCVFAEILKSTLSTSWTRITFENARIVFSSNWQLSRSTVFVRDDVIFVKNILCIACIVKTHIVYRIIMVTMQLQVAVQKGHWTLVTNFVFRTCCIIDGNKKLRTSNNTH